MKNTKHILALLALVCALARPSFAEAPKAQAVAPAKLTERDKGDIERIERYLNALKSVSADFMQINDSGELRTGKIAIQRPGKMRVTYAPPSKDFIISDGSFVHIWDGELNQQTNVPVGSSIAELILRDPIKLSGDVVITHYARYPAKLELSVASSKDPSEGELTLIFEDKPLQLRQWRVLDAQGRTTGVNLENAHEDVPFPDGTFSFMPPNLGKPQKGNQ